MLAELAKAPPTSGDWHYERKLDGLRVVAVRDGDRVELWSRGRQRFDHRFPHVVTALAGLPLDSVTLDGEIVALEGDQTSFSLLQRPGSTAEPVYFVFDVLHLRGEDTRALPRRSGPRSCGGCSRRRRSSAGSTPSRVTRHSSSRERASWAGRG